MMVAAEFIRNQTIERLSWCHWHCACWDLAFYWTSYHIMISTIVKALFHRALMKQFVIVPSLCKGSDERRNTLRFCKSLRNGTFPMLLLEILEKHTHRRKKEHLLVILHLQRLLICYTADAKVVVFCVSLQIYVNLTFGFVLLFFWQSCSISLFHWSIRLLNFQWACSLSFRCGCYRQ